MDADKRAITFPLLELPIVVIDVVAKFLTSQELSLCCAVSRDMRELFGSDLVWARHCRRVLVDYLNNAPCTVQLSKFIDPQKKRTTLSPLSKYRLAFMRENRLWYNWRHGNYTEEKIRREGDDGKEYCHYHMFFNNDCVIAMYADRAEILDVRNFTDATNAIYFGLYSPSGSSVRRLHVWKDLLILVDYSIVVVYHVNLDTKQSTLRHAFFVEKQEKIISEKPEKGAVITMHHLAEPFFIGILDDKPILHIWNIETGVKVKQEACPIRQCKIVSIKSSKTMNLIMFLKQKGEECISLVYSLTKLTFLPFSEKFPMSCEHYVYNDVLAVYLADILFVWNYVTSEKLHSLLFSGASNIKMIDNVLVFIGIDKRLYKLSMQTWQAEAVCNGLITWFEMLHNKFVQVTKYYSGREIWEIRNNFKVNKITTKFSFDMCDFFLNEACTRYIVRYGATGHLINFW